MFTGLYHNHKTKLLYSRLSNSLKIWYVVYYLFSFLELICLLIIIIIVLIYLEITERFNVPHLKNFNLCMITINLKQTSNTNMSNLTKQVNLQNNIIYKIVHFWDFRYLLFIYLFLNIHSKYIFLLISSICMLLLV